MRTPILLLLLIVASTLSAQQTERTARPIAGVVNGDTVWLDVFSREVGRKAELSKQVETITQSDVIEQAWQEIVQMILLRQEAQRRGITITRREVDSILLYATPDFVKQGVVDDKGRFDSKLLFAMATNPDSLVAVRGSGLSVEARKQQSARLKGSMDELRGRIAHLTLIEELKKDVFESFNVDSAQLRKQFIELATTATAEVMYFPCPKVEASPNEAELEAYFKAHAERYTTEREVRRLAIIAWPMNAAPVDSVLVLENISSWIAALNGATSAKAKDTVWNSVASVVSSGTIRLHPDSAAQSLFYKQCLGKQRGSVVGPIMHPSGVHVLLVDTVQALKGRKEKSYSVRVAVTEITPSKETTDSILSEVSTAGEMYDRGTNLGDVATKFDKKIDVTPFFGNGDKLYGSYRLVNSAFEVRLGESCPAVDVMQRGVVVGVVIDSVPPGPLPLEAALEQVLRDMQTELGCTSIEKSVKSYAGIIVIMDGGTMLIPEAPKGVTILRDVTVTMDGLIGQSLVDPFAGSAICNAGRTGLMSAFRGDVGWYIVNVLSLQLPPAEDFPLFMIANGDQLITEQKSKYWNTWADNVRKKAVIEDLRWMYFRY